MGKVQHEKYSFVLEKHNFILENTPPHGGDIFILVPREDLVSSSLVMLKTQ